ncbi:hypothetical protein GCM10020331_077490 [Ectobacillus funiculus]
MPEELRSKLILAGGLSTDNVKEAAALVRPYMIDASSSLETDGKKDVKKNKGIYRKKVKESQHA